MCKTTMRVFLSQLGMLLVSLFVAHSIVAAPKKQDARYTLFPVRTFYLGVNIGGGATTWSYLVDKIDPFVTGATPTAAKEFGPSWGVVLGYNPIKNFSIELQYMQFADSHLTFRIDPGYNVYNLTSPDVVSQTSAFSLSGKFYLPVYAGLRLFSAIGADVVIRKDVINNTSCITPYMSAGASYNFTRHIISETGFQYYTGFGASEVSPAKHFVPFAWDAYYRFTYQFSAI